MAAGLAIVLLPAAVASAAAAHAGERNSSCAVFLNGTLLGGSDNLNESFATTSPAACCAKCDSLDACVAFTWNGDQDHCWLKAGAVSAHSGSGNGVSGRKDGVIPTPAPAPPPPPPLPPVVKCTGRCPNILHLVSDDMRPNLGCYGHNFMKTPNLDKLAATGLQFDFAYTQFAYCAPSRNSFMSGRRPDRTRALNFMTTFRQCRESVAPGCGPGAAWVALPEFFRIHGYWTSSAGKVYHDGMDDHDSWSYRSNQTAWFGCSKGDVMDPLGNYCGLTAASTNQLTDEDLSLAEAQDKLNAMETQTRMALARHGDIHFTQGLKRMRLGQASGKPWWVSIGNHRPHTTFRVPAGFHGTELYPNGTGDVVVPPKHPGPGVDIPWMSGNWQGGDISDPAHNIGQGSPSPVNGCPTCIIPDNRTVEYRRWYYAAVSWSDHKLGEALDELESMGAAVSDNTITIFHSDHGWQLGELNEWSKKTNTELATHIPMLIRVPWKKASVGARTTVKMELVDLYRTLADLAALPMSTVQPSVQGMSLAAVFDSPTKLPAALAEKPAFSQIGRCDCGEWQTRKGPTKECAGNACCTIATTGGSYNYMGYTMRTRQWRLTAWLPFNDTLAQVATPWPSLADMAGRIELYDLEKDDGRDFDFDGYSVNLAGRPAHAATLQALWKQLEAAVPTWL